MKNKIILLPFMIVIVLLAGCQPVLTTVQPDAVSVSRTIRIDYQDLLPTNSIPATEEAQYRAAGMTRVAVSAGRVDWSFFPWPGHSSAWADPVKQSGVNFLTRDARRFNDWADVTAVVDVLAPIYIKTHPEAAAISWVGVASKDQVSLAQMTTGEFSRELLDFIDSAATVDSVDSIAIVELFYYVDGFGADDLASFKLDSGLSDWPRTDNGEIDINSPFITEWRTRLVSGFLSKVKNITRAHGKQLWLEVKPDALQLATQDWSAYAAYLQEVDRLIVMGNPILNGGDLKSVQMTIDHLKALGQDRLVYEVGAWQGDPLVATFPVPVNPDQFAALVKTAYDCGITDLWITPSYLLSPEHWSRLDGIFILDPVPGLKP